MNNRKHSEKNRFCVLLIVILIIISSCKKDDENNSGYFGKWMAAKAVPATSGYAPYLDVSYYLTFFNTNRFNESFYLHTQDYNYRPMIKYVSIDGSFLVSGNNMEFKVEKISFSNYNAQKEVLESPYSISNDQEIKNALHSFIKITSSHNAEFSLNGNKLTLSVDYNENGNYLDYDEVLAYKRQ